MSARDKLQEMANESNVSTKFVMKMFDFIIEAVKEEIQPIPPIPEKPFVACSSLDCGKLILVDKIGYGAKCVKCGKEVPYPCNPKAEPELIQGYTEKQWHEIIDGKYLCEGYAENNKWVPVILKKFTAGHTMFAFVSEDDFHYSLCRPAQFKGIMRPIFVEPSSDKSMCVFFGEDGYLVDTAPWRQKDELLIKASHLTKYIEM